MAITVRGTAEQQAREVERAKRALELESAPPVPKARSGPYIAPPDNIRREARALLESARDHRGRLQ